ncbi:MAG: agmatine deiminase family protein [Verrucomicrobiota bacterium]
MKPLDIPSGAYQMPAEWDRHEATLLAWPVNEETWPEHRAQVIDTYLELIRAICSSEKCLLLSPDCQTSEEIESALDPSNPFDRKQLQIIQIPYNDSWVRDTGPIFVRDPDNSLIALDFRFNAWGNKYEPWSDDDQWAKRFCRMFDYPLFSYDSFVLEGGSIEVNGQGTLLTTRQCLLNRNRNPSLNQQEIEDILKMSLGIQRILWLDQGIEGDDTDGHIDDLARFVDPQRVLTMRAHSKQDSNYAILENNFQLLRKMSDQDGNPLEIIDIPLPDIDLNGPFGRSPASYANFYLTNRSVLVPVYGAPNEEGVLSVFRDVFPERDIRPIDCRALVCGLGAIHCITQQVPILKYEG